MSVFRTKINIQSQQKTIDYKSNVLLLGSCFTNNIGLKLDYLKFKTFINPFGILFHPKAIENLIERSLSGKIYSEDELVFQNEQWHCLDIHSEFSHSDKSVVLDYINIALKETKIYLKNASHIVVTLGTSWVYRYNETNNRVANCHKIPQNKFTKELLSVNEVQQSLQNTIKAIQSINTNCQIIFTLSPVRHLKDGFVENQLSKAHLLTAIHQVLNKQTYYFPAYEIMMDDLRDYRFYNSDMLHPNQVAIDYIWDNFANTWIDSSEKETMKTIEQIQKGLAHKPFNFKSEKHQFFLGQIHQKINNLEKKKGIRFNS